MNGIKKTNKHSHFYAFLVVLKNEIIWKIMKFGYHISKRKHICDLYLWAWLLIITLFILRNISNNNLDWDSKNYVSFDVSRKIDFQLFQPKFHKPNEPPSWVVWLVHQTSFSLSENIGCRFKQDPNQFEKQIYSLPNGTKL